MKQKALEYHSQNGTGNGKIEVIPKTPLKDKQDLSLAYSPGVAFPCLEISNHPESVFDYTIKGNTVLVVSDGSAVLGLGNLGAMGAIPVMEGKALLFKAFGGIDAYPIVLNTQDTDEIIETVKRISPIAGGINLEDISAPRCFEIETRLKAELDIPVFHDDQHGTAVVSLAGIINALKIVEKSKESVKVVINGSGSAGVAIAKLFIHYGISNIVMCDSVGSIFRGRTVRMNPSKEELANITNPKNIEGTLADVIRDADIFLGVSAKDVLTPDMVRTMANNPIVFAMANPDPEIDPKLAAQAGVKIMATGRSDYPNQVNNVLGFPGIFRGLLEVRATGVTEDMKLAAALSLANSVTEEDRAQNIIIPSVYQIEVFAKEAEAVARQAIADGKARIQPKKGEVYEKTLRILKENQKRFLKQ